MLAGQARPKGFQPLPGSSFRCHPLRGLTLSLTFLPMAIGTGPPLEEKGKGAGPYHALDTLHVAL